MSKKDKLRKRLMRLDRNLSFDELETSKPFSKHMAIRGASRKEEALTAHSGNPDATR